MAEMIPGVPLPPDPADLAETDLAETVLGGPPAFTAQAVAAQAGVGLEQARRLWRALGFPEPGNETAYTQADLDAVTLVARQLASGLLDFDTALHVTRALGSTIARLADWEVATLLQRVEEPQAGAVAEAARQPRQLLTELNPAFEELLVYAWRRHLAAAITRYQAQAERDDDLGAGQLTVGFADIVGFAALSNEVGEQRIGDLVELFEARCSDVVAAHRGRVVKSIGDSVLFVNDDPGAALDTAEQIIEVVGRDSRMPDVRVGLATGSVVMRLGDVFGPCVNLAARLTAVARRNRVIVDSATADLLDRDAYESRRMPPRPLRGFGLVEPVTVRRR